MKIDRVLTMSECLASGYGGVSCVNPPTNDARHVPITAKGDIGPKNKARACRCNRWGHLSPSCPEERKPRLCPASDELLL